MAHREIFDGDGVLWEVWEVRPTLAERRLRAERRTVARSTPDRRRQTQKRATLALELLQGWLAFQCKTERRRFTPIPSTWVGMDERELLDILSQAQHAKPPRRLIE
jgi:hypothetical protein